MQEIESQISNDVAINKVLNDLKYTRDIDFYLDLLFKLRDKFLLILSIKDTPGNNFSGGTINKIKKIGFTEFTTNYRHMYVGIINKGEIVFNQASADQVTPISYEGILNNIKLRVSSNSYLCGNRAEIRINDEDWSLNERALNFVVYNCENNEIVDAAGCDAFVEKPTFYHYNKEFNNEWYNDHIYMPKKYKNKISLPMKKSYYSNRKLTVQEVEKGIILPDKKIGAKYYGGVCDEKFNFIAGHQKFWSEINQLHIKHIHGSYSVQPNDIEFKDEVVIYGGAMIEHPGHMIMECFAHRTWWLVENPDNKCKIAITVVDHFVNTSEFYKFTEEFFDALGVSKDRIIYVDKPMQFKKIIVPEQASIPLYEAEPYEFTSGYTKVFQYIKENLVPGKYKKIYLAKKQTIRQNIINEEYFINFFEKRGFKIIIPEEYTVKEKAELMYGADEVVSVDGTNNLYAIFCKPSAKITVLARQRSLYNIDQALIKEVVGLKKYYLVNVSANFICKSFAKDLVLLGVTDEFKRYVKDCFNEELVDTTEDSIKSALYDYLLYLPKYYSERANYNSVKEVRMLNVLQLLSETFLGNEFDISKLDLSTNETKLKQKVKELTVQNKELLLKIDTLEEETKKLKSEQGILKNKNVLLENEQNALTTELLGIYRKLNMDLALIIEKLK